MLEMVVPLRWPFKTRLRHLCPSSTRNCSLKNSGGHREQISLLVLFQFDQKTDYAMRYTATVSQACRRRSD